MPIYEFRCKSCGERFEALCRMGTNGAGVKCPECKGKKLSRLMSTFASRSASSGSDASAARSSSACGSCSSKSCSTCRA